MPKDPTIAIRDCLAEIEDWLADFAEEPWAQIKGIGNRIRHEYFRLDDAILWQIMTVDTMSLKHALESMLTRHAGESTE